MFSKLFLSATLVFSSFAAPYAYAQTLHDVPGEFHSLDYKIKAEIYAEGFETAWGLTFLDATTALVTERGGNLRLIRNGKVETAPISGTPEVWAKDHGWNQGGLLGVAASPNYAEDGWIYLSYSHALEGSEEGDDRLAMTRVVRGRIKDNIWVDEEAVYQAPESAYSETVWHYGGRMRFDSEGHLYFTVGDRGEMPAAQSLTSPKGKIHRVHLDGSIPSDNPYVGTENALPTIFSYGHRNPQGLALSPSTGTLWESEHGPRGGDEINIVQKSNNYGWPLISYGIDYDGSIITPNRSMEGMEQPIHFWRPSIGVSGIAFYEGSEFPLWQNHLLVAALATSDLRLVTVSGDRVLHEEVIFRSDARPYSVVVGPDGAIYLLLSDPGQIIRLSAIAEDRQ